jgi:hypothetical protein
MDRSDCRGHYLKPAFERDFSGRDIPGPPPRGLCAVGWKGAAGSDLGRTYP